MQRYQQFQRFLQKAVLADFSRDHKITPKVSEEPPNSGVPKIEERVALSIETT